MKYRPDLLPEGAAAGLEIWQLTEELIPSCHVYMEAQIFTPDSRRFILHRSAHAHGSDKSDPNHRYLVCDLEQGGELFPITHEIGATAPVVTPDGRYLYYFVDETVINGGRLILKRVGLDGTQRQAVMVVDTPMKETGTRVSRPYPLSTISSDGRRLVTACFLGDGHAANAAWGLLLFELDSVKVSLILQGNSWWNMHAQYSRSLESLHSHDLLIQENHGCICDPAGQFKLSTDSVLGVDIHVIRDDGANFRDLPWGRDGNEYCQGHQCWRGRGASAVTSTDTRQPREARLIEGWPAPHAGHLGIKTPNGSRNDLSRDFHSPQFYHFATDISGNRLIMDRREQGEGRIWLAEFSADPGGPLTDFCLLADTRSAWKKTAHYHPFLSPDGRLGFFNSDESGILQAYMIRNLP